MELEQALAFIHGTDWKGSRLGLERMRELMHRLGNPQDSLKFIHVAGTNGKGSTSTMLASILTAAGQKTGLYTSPHLVRVNERFRIDGSDIPDAALCRAAEAVKEAAGGMSDAPTEFEILTAMGFWYFAAEKCGAVVLEVGLGGRLDSTNVIPAPEVAVITNIALEHTAILGDTLAAIAQEKSGILKRGCRAVLYAQSAEVEAVVSRVCAEQDIRLTVTDPAQLELLSSTPDGQTFTYRASKPLRLALLGDYQLRNVMTVLDTVDALRTRGWTISPEALAEGLASARWPGRLELVRRSPDLIIDGGHNPQCAQALAASLRALYGERKLIFLVGVLADKDWPAMVGELLPLAKRVLTVRPESERAKDENELAAWVRAEGVGAEAHATLGEALDAALAAAEADDVICAFGSLYSVGELRHHLGLC